MTETIMLGQQDGLCVSEQRLTSGIKIGGKFNNGPGQICFGAINCGNSGISGICTTNGTDGFGRLIPQQNSFGGVGL